MRATLLVGLIAGSLIAPGCASVPPESVELSRTIGEDLVELHRAHRALLVRFYQTIEDDIDTFVDGTYRPFIIRSVMEDLDLINELQASIDSGDLDPLDIMEIFAEETIANIQEYREKLRSPVVAQRDSLLLTVDDAYARLVAANSTVTGHLASIRDVHEAQQIALDRIGLSNLRAQTTDLASSLSNQLGDLLETTSRIEDSLDEAEAISDLPATIENLARVLTRTEGAER